MSDEAEEATDAADTETKQPRLDWRSPWVVSGFVLLVVLAGIVGAMAFYWTPLVALMKTAEGPAWVQAVGSVLAIFVAVLVPTIQTEMERRGRERAEFERRLRNTSVALSVASLVSYVAGEVQKELEAPDASKQLLLHKVSMVRRFCERFPMMEIENENIAGRFVGVFEAVVSLEAALMVESSETKAILKSVIALVRRFNSDFGSDYHHIMSMYYLPEHHT